MTGFSTILAAASVFALCALSGPALSQEREVPLLEDMFGAEGLDETAYAQAMLDAVPFPTLSDVIAKTRALIGDPVAVEHVSGADYLVKTASHEVPVTLVLDTEGKIAGLLIKPVAALAGSLGEVLAQLEAFEGEATYLVTRNGETTHAFGADRPLAVGSAFKLGVLAALRERIENGEASWDTTVPLAASQISAPSGVLQTFPVGSPLTLHTLAALMISISDNTATDVLIDFVGRDAAADRLGLDMVLKTRELFVLKADAHLREEFLAADTEARKAMFARFDASALPSTDALGGQHIPGIEYYVPLNRLCALMDELADLDVMSINPGAASPSDWAHIAFKGGSEQGVLNLTSSVRAESGDRYCVAVTWNADGPVNETAAISDYASLLKALRAEL